MKQSSLISILMALFAISANAQLKLTTDGNIYMHRVSEDTLSDVSIGECSMLEDYESDKKGLHVQKAISQSASCYGIYSEALKKQIIGAMQSEFTDTVWAMAITIENSELLALFQ